MHVHISLRILLRTGKVFHLLQWKSLLERSAVSCHHLCYMQVYSDLFLSDLGSAELWQCIYQNTVNFHRPLVYWTVFRIGIMWGFKVALCLRVHYVSCRCHSTVAPFSAVCYRQYCTVCPTCYRTRYFFNNFTDNKDIATKFEVDLPHCVRNVTTS